MKLPDIPKGIVKAFSHDLRKEIIGALLELEVSSPNKIAEKLDQKLSNVSYHFRVLLDECEVIELKKTEPRRGAVEHFYALTKPMKQWLAANSPKAK